MSTPEEVGIAAAATLVPAAGHASKPARNDAGAGLGKPDFSFFGGKASQNREFAAAAATGQAGPTTAALTRPGRNLDKVYRSFRLYRRGAAVVEFAMVAPVLLLLVMGMIEYGRLVMVQQVLTNATREGARHAVLDGATTSSVEGVVQSFLTTSRISGAVVTVTPSPPSHAAFGDPVTVSVQVPFSQVSWLPTPMFLSESTLSATTVMRRETAQ